MSRLRPFARRRFRTSRPFLVLIRSRKPCVLRRRLLFGWKVRFISLAPIGRSADGPQNLLWYRPRERVSTRARTTHGQDLLGCSLFASGRLGPTRPSPFPRATLLWPARHYKLFFYLYLYQARHHGHSNFRSGPAASFERLRRLGACARVPPPFVTPRGSPDDGLPKERASTTRPYSPTLSGVFHNCGKNCGNSSPLRASILSRSCCIGVPGRRKSANP